MSCYEWERGEIIIPRKEWSKFKKALIAAYNRHQDNVYTKALAIHTTMKETDKKPKRSDYAHANGASKSIRMPEASIAFGQKDPNKHTVFWSVPENNRACERAREHPVAQEFFRLLNAMTFTRNSGGKIIGNDEYNRDSDYEGGGGNFVKNEWGPNVVKPKPYNPYSYGGGVFNGGYVWNNR